MKTKFSTFSVAVLCCVLPFKAVGTEANTPMVVVEPVVEKVVDRIEGDRWLGAAHFSYLDMMLPGKVGVAIGRTDGPGNSYELEYTHGSFTPFFIDDLGKFSEDRISFVQRFGRNRSSGIQWYYGVFYHHFKLEIGNALLSRLTTYYPSADVLSISGLGGVIGVGYRWFASENFLLGIDAVTYSQPVYTLSRDMRFLDVVTDPNDREKVEAGVMAMQYFPRLGIAKLTLGYMF